MSSSRRRSIVLALAASCVTACAGETSDACPPVAAYDATFRARAAAELPLLPVSSAIEQMLADYAVMRAQSRACAAAPRPSG